MRVKLVGTLVCSCYCSFGVESTGMDKRQMTEVSEVNYT